MCQFVNMSLNVVTRQKWTQHSILGCVKNGHITTFSDVSKWTHY
jgi:hypothetical protein